MRTPVYLDNHATTPLDPRVLDAMMPFLLTKFGNAASRSHCFGWDAEKAVEFARKQVADLIGATPREIVFTSGATESNNLALKGVMEAHQSKGRHIVTVTTEHKAVIDTVGHLERQGYETTFLMPRGDGILDLEVLTASLRQDTVLVSVMYANNEIGVVQPITAIGALCRERGVLLHCDAAQAAGKLPIRLSDDLVDLMSLSAHKLYGPKGIGALYVRRARPRLPMEQQMDGGGHEGGLRSGTLNVPAIVGFGAACEICKHEMKGESKRIRAMRDRLRVKFEAALPDVYVNGSISDRLPGNLNMSFTGVDAEALLMTLNDIALSTGSACTSATVEPSHVLTCLGIGEDRTRSAVRFGVGRFNTAEEVDYVAERVIEAVQRLRSLGASARRQD